MNDRINKLRQLEARYEYGAVKGSNHEYPFQEKSFHVSGYNISDDEKKRKRIKDLEHNMMSDMTDAEEMLIDIMEFIDSIEDKTLQLMFTYYYIDGMTQEEIAGKLGMDRSRVSRRISEYLEEIEKRTQSTKLMC